MKILKISMIIMTIVIMVIMIMPPTGAPGHPGCGLAVEAAVVQSVPEEDVVSILTNIGMVIMMLATMVVQTSVREPLGVNSRGCKKGLTNLKHRSSRRDHETHFC